MVGQLVFRLETAAAIGGYGSVDCSTPIRFLAGLGRFEIALVDPGQDYLVVRCREQGIQNGE